MDNIIIEYALFNLGAPEIILILLVILLLFGAKRLPELARGLGQGIKEFKGAVDDTKKTIEDAADPESAPSEESERSSDSD